MIMTKHLILASKSPRRKEILQNLGFKFDIFVSNCDEDIEFCGNPRAYVKKLAKAKSDLLIAENISGKMFDFDQSVVLGADTIVYKKGVIGKPKDCFDAKAILQNLSGRWHSVYTGMCVQSKDKVVLVSTRSRVKFKKLSDIQIEEYIKQSRPYDKAGAYGIQDDVVVSKFVGSRSNIIGLDQTKAKTILRKMGVHNAKN